MNIHISGRQRWTLPQKKRMKEYFKNNLFNKKVIRKKDCEEFVSKNRQLFEGIGWVKIKTFIYNESKNKD